MSDLLLQQYATTYSREVAERLDGIDASEIIGLLSNLEAATAARVLSYLTSTPLKKVLSDLSPETTSRLLIESIQPATATLVAHLSTSQYPAILNATDPENRARISRLFDLPSHSLAAWATPAFIRVLATKTCGDVKRELEILDHGDVPLFVVDDMSRYLGILSPISLLSASNASHIAREIMDQVRPLPGTMEISAALSLPQWRGRTALPIVDARSNLLGAITQEALISMDHVDTLEGDLHYDDALAGFFLAAAEIFSLVFGPSRS